MKKYKFFALLLLTGAITAYPQSPELKTLSEKEVKQLEESAASRQTINKAAAAAAANTYVPNSVAIDQSKAVGEIPFSSGVSPSGAVTYSMPIEIYPGIRGFQPQIALSYNHLSGNGIAGVGWNIAGLSAVSRTTKSIYYDGTPQGVRLTKDDAFTLDGMRLIKLSETTAQIKYESEQGNIKVNANLSGSAVKYFEVFYPNGNKGTYGYTTNTVGKLSYPLTSLTDLWGNTIVYAYTFYNNRYRVSSITYGGASNASVEFQYTSLQDVISTYEGGLNIRESQVLQSITCKFNSTVLRAYNLTYQQQKNNSVLTQIGCTASYASRNPLKFYYGTNNEAYVYTNAETQLMSWYNYYDNPDIMKVARGKFDYGTDNDGIISLFNKNPYYKNSDRYVNKYSDTDNILLYTGLNDNMAMPMPNLTTEAGFIDIFCANLNGKEGDEVIKVNNVVSGNYDQINFKVYAGNLYYGLALQYTRSFNFSTLLPSKTIHPKFYYTGDFNGDGKMEVLAVSCHNPLGNTSVTSKCYLFDLESNTKLYEGYAFPYNVEFTATEYHTGSAGTDRLYVMDYDGDGKDDICLINDDGVNRD